MRCIAVLDQFQKTFAWAFAQSLKGRQAQKGYCRKIAPLLLLVVGLSFVSGPGFAADWVIKRVSGTVYLVAPGVKAFRAKTGMPLQKGFTVATRKGARALIARGAETILVGPNTTFALSRYRSKGGKTTLLQKSGDLQIDVVKRSRPHFSVETPFLAAVVKGTRFSIKVGKKTARVSVERGLVGVNDFASGDRVNLGPGQRASTEPEKKVGLTVGGKVLPTVKKGAKAAPTFVTPAVTNVPTTTSEATSSSTSSSSGSTSDTETDSAGNGNSGNSNASGNSNGNSGNSNAGGNGNGNSGNSNAGGNSNGNGNSGNSNAGGNGNGNSGNSNAGGNSNSNGNSGNSNAGGNGNGNSGNSNAGGNSNGNGNSGNSNAGGNGKGNED
ncbi:hypothetical protein DYI23_02295 [Roseibium polysiphoniae]|uniref:FecR protein domain-containing protein n=1 Tax=Roseibium polysiphoniae TaxID=2571221 RepID=A0A944CAT1_9HYPH|nr:hypothetical protein [Roseibium polysiphoniae]